MKEVFEGWIARDKDGALFVHQRQPKRYNDNIDQLHYWVNGGERFSIRKMDKMFSDLKWEDEPRKVTITIETIE